MSKGGWARLTKQQQLVAHEDNSTKYKDINSKQQLPKPQNMNVNSCYINTPTGTMLQVALHDQSVIKASKILQIVKKWRSHSGARQITTRRCRSSPSPARSSSSCTKLGLMPLRSCVTFSNIHLHSDDDNEEEEEVNDDERGFASVRRSRSTSIRRWGSGGNVGGPARALSCPKLGSPLGSCTPFQSIKGSNELDEENDEERIMKLITSSSPSPSPSGSSKSTPTTPKGYLALYVGEERRRFLVKASLLNHPLFGILLDKAKEEFGFNQQGPLNIPCDISFFQHILLLVQSNDPSHRNADHSTLFNSPDLAASVM